MLYTIIQKNNYQDSIVLMLLTNRLLTVDGVSNASVMMGTPANKDIFKTGGIYTDEMAAATSNDMVLVLDIEDKDLIDIVLKEVADFIADQGKSSGEEGPQTVKTWEKALEAGEAAATAVLSIPGTLAAPEIETALEAGKHVFCFSDNVSIEDEVRLKKMAHDKGLLLMGPDCGTGIINGIPVAFTNAVRKGSIGIVGASGTGIQEVTTIIHKLGAGVTQALGTGGRDLSEAVGGITVKDSIIALENDPETKVIVVISKPPAPQVRDEVLDLLRKGTKPAVTIFLGEKPTDHEVGLYRAYTLEEAAQIAVQLLHEEAVIPIDEMIDQSKTIFSPKQQKIKAYYSGGTLAYEAAMLVKAGLQLSEDAAHEDGYILKAQGHEIIDLGDDIYTQGKPHPMIDPSKRKEMLQQAAADPATAVILLDIVLGYGSHADMASELAPTIKELKANAALADRSLAIIGTIVGTDLDPQDINKQAAILTEAGVTLCQSNAQAVKKALVLLGHPLPNITRKLLPKSQPTEALPQPSEAVVQLLKNQAFINVGLRSFAEAIREHHGSVIQYDWQPVAGGNVTLQKALRFLAQASLKE
ncbi:acyl-CoA synthetase FdrA [Enterococcus sp. BWT-B8]|uniref:acyl-CoA synthetase FdrA n=1 Tax=Enterococcus sp. BWT-B8 TaxID=2885157 RepID=UPI001E411342|nr:acyl-CoA synthetase FdrA [Enterococcus sp. BWT-B8]MCB5951219.1 acyl-CoA synthetase FdrA [Enterococcus sp. BWT-B8]